MNQEITTRGPIKSLRRELTGFQVTTSPLCLDFSFDELFTEITSCTVIKENARRQVFYLQTPTGGYFLKLSTLIRSKDRRRHFLLPSRKWAEWRNLHRLLNAGIVTATPVMKGESKGSFPHMFFLLTAEVSGQPLGIKSAADAANMGEYAAMLHSYGIFHADLHPHNIIINPEGQACLIDVQEVYFMPWMPRWLRVSNLGKLYFNISPVDDSTKWLAGFIDGYNHKSGDQISAADLIKAAQHHQQRKYRSRSKRCCKNSTEFTVIKQSVMGGYKRRDFNWGAQELQRAVKRGQSLKDAQVIYHNGVCIKNRSRSFFHRDRCLDSWKMSRALEVRGISVPRALAYVVFKGRNYFLSELLDDSLHLNDYLSSIIDARAKRQELKKLALWVRKIHDAHVWQRDFKSNNILCQQGQYYMIDLDGVRIRRLTGRDRITNLAQLNASLSNAITIKDRLRFFDCYSADERSSRHQRREFYREIWDITRTKSTAYYGLDLKKLDLCN